jgi:predicted nucleic acid-binding protein
VTVWPLFPPETVCTSIVVACELRLGALKRGSVPLQNRVDALLWNLTVLALDGEADRHYAEIRLEGVTKTDAINWHGQCSAATLTD